MNIKLLRGVSGSGKSTYSRFQAEIANKQGKRCSICSADDYFLDENGDYKFDFEKLENAHRNCFAEFCAKVDTAYDLIIVDNTNTRLWELSPYIAYANISMIPLQDTLEVIRFNCSVSLASDRNIHGVPRGSIENMKNRIETLPSCWPLEQIIQTNK